MIKKQKLKIINCLHQKDAPFCFVRVAPLGMGSIEIAENKEGPGFSDSDGITYCG